MTGQEMAARIAELESQIAAMAEKKTRKPREQHPCHCGCGQPTYATFAMGHDARHRGELLRALLAGDKAAGDDLIAHGWETQQTVAGRIAEEETTRNAAVAKEIAKQTRAAERRTAGKK